jgi:CMP/dCMP kinase
MKQITIAIDGYSSCGKSTLAKALAKKIGYIYVDSGAMYRGVTLFAMRNNLISDGAVNEADLINQLKNINIAFKLNADTGLPDLYLNNENVETEIRQITIANNVSKVAAIKQVRSFLVEKQRIMGQEGGVVMDGRDIGSVVFPNAELKLFVTADPAIRVQRRYDELKAKGDKVSYEEVEKNLRERDYLDTTRAESPLIQVEDAVVLDNTNLTREEQLQKAYDLAMARV